MIWTCAELIHFFSRNFTLKPGMVIITGTPAGTAWSADKELGGKGVHQPGLVPATRYCLPGDVVECEVEKIGVLRNTGASRRGASPPNTAVDAAEDKKSKRNRGKSMDRRKFVQGALAAPFVAALPLEARAQAWPTRNITMIVAFPPGGQADLAARPVAAALEKILGRSVVVDNRSGAGGMLGNAAAARAEPDGHTLLMALSSMMFLPEAERLYDRKPSYELDHFVPIARVLADPGVLCVRADAPWKTVADLVADAKKRPGQISFSSSGNYGAAHVPFEMFQQAAGIKLLHVPYRGGGPALTAFLGKQVDITAQAPGADHSACAERRGAAAGELGPASATAGLSRRPDLDRARLQGRRILHLGRAVCAEGHARAGDHAAARRHARGDGEPAGDRRVRQGRRARRPTWTSRNSRSSSRPTPSVSSP